MDSIELDEHSELNVDGMRTRFETLIADYKQKKQFIAAKTLELNWVKYMIDRNTFKVQDAEKKLQLLRKSHEALKHAVSKTDALEAAIEAEKKKYAEATELYHASSEQARKEYNAKVTLMAKFEEDAAARIEETKQKVREEFEPKMEILNEEIKATRKALDQMGKDVAKAELERNTKRLEIRKNFKTQSQKQIVEAKVQMAEIDSKCEALREEVHNAVDAIKIQSNKKLRPLQEELASIVAERERLEEEVCRMQAAGDAPNTSGALKGILKNTPAKNKTAVVTPQVSERKRISSPPPMSSVKKSPSKKYKRRKLPSLNPVHPYLDFQRSLEDSE